MHSSNVQIHSKARASSAAAAAATTTTAPLAAMGVVRLDISSHDSRWQLALVLKSSCYPPPLSAPFGRPHRLGLPMVVCVECLPADKPWDVVSATCRSSGVAPRACVRVYVRVTTRVVSMYMHAYIRLSLLELGISAPPSLSHFLAGFAIATHGWRWGRLLFACAV